MYRVIKQIKGGEAGGTSMILAGVHGNETCGIEALKNILPNLIIERGIVLIGYGNPRAIETGKRYTEANLNRMFVATSSLSEKEKASYEYRRAQFLKPYLYKAEALLDIHASSIRNSRAFAICEKNGKDLVKHLPINLVVSGFDKVEPGSTDYFMNRNGKIGICLECGYLGNPKSTKIAEESVIAFLKTRGHLTGDTYPREQSCIRVFKKYFTQSNKFTLTKAFENFEALKKGQVIGIDGQEEIKAPKPCVILFAHNCNKTRSEAFLLGQ